MRMCTRGYDNTSDDVLFTVHTLCTYSTYTVPTVHTLCTYSTYAVYLQCIRCVPSVHTLCTYSTYAVYLQYIHCVLTVPTLCTFSAYTVYLQYIHCVPTVHTLCTFSAYAVYLQYIHCVPSVHTLCTYSMGLQPPGRGPAPVRLDSITGPRDFVEIPTIMWLKLILIKIQCIFTPKCNLNKQYNIGMNNKSINHIYYN
jgi:hypothetical protein